MFYFVMVGDERFLSIAEYIAPQLALGAAMLVRAVGLALRGARRADDDEDEKGSIGHDWSSAMALCVAAHGVGAAAGTACLAARDAGSDSRANTAVVVATLAIGHAALFAGARRFVFTQRASSGDASPREPAWVTVKAVTLATTGDGARRDDAFFNFPLAWALSVAIAPPCLTAGPSDRGRSSIRAAVMATAPVVVAAVAARVAGVPAAEAAGAFAGRTSAMGGRDVRAPAGVRGRVAGMRAERDRVRGREGGVEESEEESKKTR